MTWLFHDDRFQLHQTGSHPECPQRLERIDRHLQATQLQQQCRTVRWEIPPRKTLERLHGGAYLDQLQAAAASGGGVLDSDTVISGQSWEVALHAAGAACQAVDQVLAGERDNALCLIRPPGHHALRDRAMGFCLLNNIAIAARHAVDHGELDRIMIVDWDVHHGNGTQDAFYEEGQIGFLSIHRSPFYPGTGAADETGLGGGLGATCNVPLAMGVDRREYFDRFERALTDMATRLRPQLLLVSAGFDSHRLDPVGSLGLETEDFAALTDLVQQTADQHCQGKLVSLLEGGYNIDVLPHCVESHLRRLLEASP